MSWAPILTIAIPTHDRNELLAKHVSQLLAQLTPDVRLLIIDNACKTPVSTVLGPLPAGAKLVRNAVNIGGNANILRCLEQAETPWVVVIGDDDRPLPDMVSRILRDIASNPEAALLHYASTNMHKRSSEWKTQGREEFLSRIDSFANLLFISSSVFHVARLRIGFDRAYHFGYSCAPHLALLFSGMESRSIVIFRSASLVEWRLPEIENRGSKNTMALGLLTLLELPFSAKERRLLAKHISAFIGCGELLHEALLGILFGGQTRLEALRRYLHALHRFPLVYAPLRRFWGWYLAIMILTPRITYAVVGRIAQRVIGRPMGRENFRVDKH